MSQTASEIAKREDPYLSLIQEVTANPDLSAEKLKILVDMRLLLEDREAEKKFKAAMSRARKQIKALAWDKKGDNNRYVSYPKIEAMLEPIRDEHGFTQSFDTEVSSVPGQMIFCCDVFHDGGYTKRYRLPMSIDGQGPKGGGVMTGAQAVGNGTSYAMRYLQKMIWNIPMLVDKDDTDGNVPLATINKQQLSALQKLVKDTKTNVAKFCEYLRVEKLEDLPADKFKDATAALEKKRARVSESQAADLTALAEEVKADVPAFCKEFGVKAVANIPASRYEDAVKSLEAKR